ncbi:MAG: two-component system sensor histidine kinase CreC, partial [Deltaproteobacteria bacterium]|nr:two-component system sensor histidine kinase CreC [Deltaproteobacteria bacterium]
MKLGLRIFLCYFLIFAACFYFPINWVLDHLRVRYLEGVEDPLVDQANIMAAIVAKEMEKGSFDEKRWDRIFNDVKSRELSSRIYDFEKKNVDMSIYITDKNGVVIFDSEERANIGKNFLKWRDVRLTLRGEYGARTTRKYVNDNKSSVLYIAAPIIKKGRIEGALTIAKPTTNINNYIDKAKPEILRVSLLSALCAIVLSLVATLWIIRPINRLKLYAEDIRQGKRTPFPRLDRTEIGEMGIAFERMKEALEGKKYVEQYIQTLTHEIKSPVSAIRGAAELLEENMPEERRERFLANIRTEANRIQNIIDRMLELSELENRNRLHQLKEINPGAMIRTVIESKQPMLLKKNIAVNLKIDDALHVIGDQFLLHQAISNLVQNAIDFSPSASEILVSANKDGDMIAIEVIDNGSGIPEYALEKIF